MKKVFVLICALLIYQISIAQSRLLEEIIDEIEFQSDTIKSVYDWIADNIEYDVTRLNDIKSGDTSPPKRGIESLEELRELQLQEVISKKKGVCEDYSILFDALAKELGYTSSIIEGYTKNEQGKVERRLGHAWNAVKVKGVWSLYDPTWGAGYLEDGRRFIKHYNKEWFDISSKEMIKTHMPYDPIWQLLEHPVNYQCFESGADTSLYESTYNFKELIRSYLQKDRKDQMKDQLSRSENIGDGIWLIKRWRNSMRSQIDHYDLTHQTLSIDEVNNILEESSKLFNDYIKARNKQFRNKKWSRAYSKQVLEKIKTDLNIVLTSLSNVEVADSKINRSVEKVIIQTERFVQRINEEIDYLGKTTE